MYRRKIEDILHRWKKTPNHKPLVIKGCRQCGKTSSVKSFAQQHYKHVVYMDFHEQKELCALFEGSLKIDYLTVVITAAIPGATFVSGETCLILDEIQECPKPSAPSSPHMM